MATEKENKQEIFVDEFGDPGNDPKIGESGRYEPSRIFGYAASVKGADGDFATILIRTLSPSAAPNPRSSNRETKARRLPISVKEIIAKEIRSTGTACQAYYVDKLGELPDGWKDLSGSERMVGLLMYTVGRILETVGAGEVLFVIDEHNAYKVGNLYTFMENEFDSLSLRTGKRIGFCIASSSHGPYSQSLQTHDVIANVSLESAERGNKHLALFAGIKTYRLNNKDSILFPALRKR